MELNELTQKGKRGKVISVDTCFQDFREIPIIDVRSPGEFEKAHIPGAVSIPLFNNDERAIVGTTYKQQSREAAIEVGYEIVEPKLQMFLDEARKVAPNGEVTVHCWRGGMRSAAFARHLSENGFDTVRVIEGGYKAFRNYVLDAFKQNFKLRILGGYTGSGKTEILKCLAEKGQQVLDLEGLANHRGSAFGGIDLPAQPSVEMFENLLFNALHQLDLSKAIWVEDESHYIGSVFIPNDFFRNIKAQQLYFLNIPLEERARHLVDVYASLSKDQLAVSIQKISKRLGYNHATHALKLLEDNQYFEVVCICLTYYDKLYTKGLKLRDQKLVKEIELAKTNHNANAELLIEVTK